MTVDSNHFDRIVTSFFNAATGALTWGQALEPLHAALGTRFAVLQSIDLDTGRLIQLSHGGESMDAGVLDYLRHWHEVDPRRRRLLSNPASMLDRWWHCHEHFDAAFVARDRFYREFLTAHDSRYLATLVTLVTPRLMTALALELPAARGPLTADERHTMLRLGQHMTDALRAHERVRRMAVQALVGRTLLDGFSYPMWLLDAERHVVHANAAAHEASEAVRENVESVAGRLVLRSNPADRRLGIALHTLGNGRHGMRSSIDVRVRRSDVPSWLHLHVLEPQRVLGAFGDRPLVLATLFDPRQMRELDPFALTDLFGMTPTQARVAVLLAEGLTAQAIGERLGCSVNTVRTHLRRVMGKLGAVRLADAVRVLRQGEALWAMPASRREPGAGSFSGDR